MKFQEHSTKKKFVNHLGLKLQNRKEERRQKRKKNRPKQDGMNGHPPKNDKSEKKGKGLGGQMLKNLNVKKKKANSAVDQGSDDVGGFQITSTNSDRLARLQEFVSQEAGKMERANSSNPVPLSKSRVESNKKENLIKNKQKLLSLQRDQKEDTKEINKMAKLLRLRPTQKKKVAPIFADDFGDILADIEDGTMSRSNEYDDKKGLKKSILYESEPEVSSELEESEDDGSKSHVDTRKKVIDIKRSRKNGHSGGGHQSCSSDDDNEGFSNSGADNGSRQQDGDMSDSEEGNTVSEEEDDSDDDGHPKRGVFFDMEAEVSDEEESDERELVHDDTKEYELAFEGGSSYAINNGALDDINQYSSDSGDDIDLEDFIVDDDYLEHMSEEDDLLEKADKLLMAKEKKKKRRRILSIESETEQNTGTDSEMELLKNEIASDSEKDNSLQGRQRRRLEIRSDSDMEHISSPIKKKKKLNNVKDLEESFEDSYTNGEVDLKQRGNLDNHANDVIQPTGLQKTKGKKEHTLSSSDGSKSNLESDIKCKEINLNLLSLPKKKKKKKKKQVVKTEAEGENSVVMTTSATDGNQSSLMIKRENQHTVVNGENAFNLSLPVQAEETVDVNDDSSIRKKNKKKKKKKGLKNPLCNSEDKEKNCLEENPLVEFSEQNEKSNGDLKKGFDNNFEADSIKEDIYGRLRDKEGNVLKDKETEVGGKYIPPALRKLMALSISEKKKEQLAMLKKNLKGLINRLAESNMAGIASQIEGLYSKHSQNDMNECLSLLLFEALVLPTMTPERLVQEHMLLIAVLSANVGNQVSCL